MMLTGDIEPAAQRALLARGSVPPVDVLKVAHHGSAAQERRLLAAADPRVALISVGDDNDYGHPAPATLAGLARSGAVLGRTDRDGALAVVADAAGLRLVTRGG
jgi:competence protein ComEC